MLVFITEDSIQVSITLYIKSVFIVKDELLVAITEDLMEMTLTSNTKD